MWHLTLEPTFYVSLCSYYSTRAFTYLIGGHFENARMQISDLYYMTSTLLVL